MTENSIHTDAFPNTHDPELSTKVELPVFHFLEPLSKTAQEHLKEDQEWLSVRMVDISDSNDALKQALQETIKPELISTFDLSESGITKMIEDPKWNQDKQGYPQPNRPAEGVIPFNRTAFSMSRDYAGQSMLVEGGAAFCALVLSFDELGNANIWHEQSLYESGWGDDWAGRMKNSMEFFLRSGFRGEKRRIMIAGMDATDKERLGVARKVDAMVERLNAERNGENPIKTNYLFATREQEIIDGEKYQHCIYSCVYIPPALHKDNKTEVFLVGSKVKRRETLSISNKRDVV